MEGDLEKSTLLLKDIQEKCVDMTKHVNEMCKKASNNEFSTSKGISFLEVKYQLLLSYLVNLTYILLRKSHGQSIEGDDAVEHLVEIRTVLEKMRPIDQKLKYQVDKVIRLAATGGAASDDPMRFKANPDGLESKVDEGSGSGESESEDEDTSKPYRPPKLAAVHYDGDETVEDKKQKQMASQRKRALNSDILQDLRAQYDDAPQEIRESSDFHRMKEDKYMKNRTRYEEEHFTRLQLTKKDKMSQQKVATISSLNSITKFGSISALDMEGEAASEFPSKRRKTDKGKGSKGGKGKKGKKGFKRKRRH